MLVVFGALAVWNVFVIVSDLLEANLASRLITDSSVSLSDIDHNDDRQLAASIVWGVLQLAAAVAWIRWFHWAYKNVPGVGGARRYGAGWAIGGWFVPILGLWRPKEIANDIWAATARRPDALLNWWWGLWIFSELLSRLALRGDPSSASELQTQDRVDALFAGVQIVTAILACLVASRATERLTAAREGGGTMP